MISASRHSTKWAALIVLGCAVTAPVLARGAEPVSNPDPVLAAYYREHAGDIQRLQSIVENRAAPVSARQQALEDLSRDYHDSALASAAKIITDPATDIALRAIEELANSVVMSGSEGGDAHVAVAAVKSPAQAYHDSLHDLARNALRVALTDPRPEVRKGALRALVPLSDEAALAAVQQSAKAGQIPETDAVKYCALATSKQGRACLINFLAEGSPAAKNVAVQYLGSIPSYQPLVRNKIFLSADTDPTLRATAAEVLGRYDPGYTNYALTVTLDPKTPPELFASAVKSYVQRVGAQGKLDFAQRTVIMRAVANYQEKLIKEDPDKNAPYLKTLQDSLTTMGHVQ
jgi:hypothetical protein